MKYLNPLEIRIMKHFSFYILNYSHDSYTNSLYSFSYVPNIYRFLRGAMANKANNQNVLRRHYTFNSKRLARASFNYDK